MVIPSQGPTWNSHWAGITSAFVPLTLIPAYRQALQMAKLIYNIIRVKIYSHDMGSLDVSPVDISGPYSAVVRSLRWF